MRPSTWLRDVIPGAVCATLMLALAPFGRALAVDLLGLYVGGSVGEARIEADPANFLDPAGIGSFHGNHSAFKLMTGIRPISLVGAELEYVDLGRASVNYASPGIVSANVSTTGLAAFGVLYLPVPVVDVFLKAGLEHLDSTVNSRYCAVDTCQFSSYTTHDNGFAAGAGVQFKFGSLAARGEFEHFEAAGGNPYLLSIGLTWSFL